MYVLKTHYQVISKIFISRRLAYAQCYIGLPLFCSDIILTQLDLDSSHMGSTQNDRYVDAWVQVHDRKRRSTFNFDAQSKLPGYHNYRRKVNERHTFPYLDAKSLT